MVKRKRNEVITLTKKMKNINLSENSVSKFAKNVTNLNIQSILIEKYFPTKLKNFIGDSNLYELKKIKDWLKDWKSSLKKRGMLIFGPTGSGKTRLAYVVSKKYKYNILELNCSDQRNSKVLKKLKLLVETDSPFIKNLLLIDDVEITTGDNQGFTKYINDLLKVTQIPIILTCSDKYERKIKTIKNNCNSIELFHPKKKEVFKFLTMILKKEGLSMDEEFINNLIQSSKCDIRYCLTNLQFYSIPISIKSSNNLEDKNKKYNIFDGSNLLFNDKVDKETKINIINSDRFMFSHYIEQNYIITGNDLSQITDRAELLGDIDLITHSINSNQNFNLIPYQANLLENVTRRSKRQRIEFPEILGKMSKIRANCEKMKNLLPSNMKSEEFDIIKPILYSPILTPNIETYENCFQIMVNNNWTIFDWKEQLFEKCDLNNNILDKKEITKRKTKFVKFYNKKFKFLKTNLKIENNKK